MACETEWDVDRVIEFNDFPAVHLLLLRGVFFTSIRRIEKQKNKKTNPLLPNVAITLPAGSAHLAIGAHDE